MTVLTPGSGGLVRDGKGNAWTLSAAGVVEVGGAVVAGGSGTSELTVVDGVIWGLSASNGEWYTHTNGQWNGQGTATPPLTPVVIVPPAPPAPPVITPPAPPVVTVPTPPVTLPASSTLPTSPAGLKPGAYWNDGGSLAIVGGDVT